MAASFQIHSRSGAYSSGVNMYRTSLNTYQKFERRGLKQLHGLACAISYANIDAAKSLSTSNRSKRVDGKTMHIDRLDIKNRSYPHLDP